MKRSDSLVPFSRRFFTFASRYRDVRLWFAPAGPARVTGGPGVGDPGPRPDMHRGESRASQVPGEPYCAYAVFCDPGGTYHTQPTQCVGTAPVFRKTKARRGLASLGVRWTALTLAVYASQCGLQRPTQDSLPAAGQALPGGIGYPQGSNERFQR